MADKVSEESKKGILDKLLDFLYGKPEAPGDPYKWGAGHSLAKAVDFPFPHDPSLNDVSVQEVPADKMPEFGTMGQNFLNRGIIRYSPEMIDLVNMVKRDPPVREAYGMGMDPRSIKGILGHEFGHSYQTGRREKLRREENPNQDPYQEWEGAWRKRQPKHYEDMFPYWLGELGEGRPVPDYFEKLLEKLRNSR